MGDSVYCAKCNGRTDGYYEVGGHPCRCLSRPPSTEERAWCSILDAPMCGAMQGVYACTRVQNHDGDHVAMGEDVVFVRWKAGLPPLTVPSDPTHPYVLTNDDINFLRTNRIDPEVDE